MRSKIPTPTMSVQDAVAANSANALVRETREYCFVSPVFGGGVKVDGHRKPADGVTPVRGSAIRGQLRFWWRAVNPQGAGSLRALFEAEAKVFGAAAGGAEGTAGTLDVRVVSQPRGPKAFHVLKQGDQFRSEQGLEPLAYGAFPLRDPDQAARHSTLHLYEGSWSVNFAYSRDLEDDVHAALWAWAHFGGLGGRTRRGFGAIAQRSPKLLGIEDGMTRWLGDRSPNNGALPWPHVTRDPALLVRGPKSYEKGLEAQIHLLKQLRLLRQGSIGRKPQGPGENRPGRSYWPEPDAIRAETHQMAPDHAHPVTTVHAAPRAAFGMPIVFHFKDRGDPGDCQLRPRLNGRELGRLASPLILRPHDRGDGKFEALALVLAHPKPTDVAFVSTGRVGRTYPMRSTVTVDEAKTLKPLQAPAGVTAPFTDPLQRYLHLLRNGS